MTDGDKRGSEVSCMFEGSCYVVGGLQDVGGEPRMRGLDG